MLEENAKAMKWSSAPGVQDCGGSGKSPTSARALLLFSVSVCLSRGRGRGRRRACANVRCVRIVELSSCSAQGPKFDAVTFSASFGCNQWEGDAQRTRKLYDPIQSWCNQPAQQQLGISCTVSSSINWKQGEGTQKRWDNLTWVPWMELHPDREISTAYARQQPPPQIHFGFFCFLFWLFFMKGVNSREALASAPSSQYRRSEALQQYRLSLWSCSTAYTMLTCARLMTSSHSSVC